jgi:uncharacterized protein (TIGR02145 family)
LKSTTGWCGFCNGSYNGTDDFGFSALPGGNRNSDGRFFNSGELGIYWTATELGGGDAYGRGIYWISPWVYVFDDYYLKDFGFSVRCVKD